MAKIIGKNLPNMPWQEPGNAERLPVWRYNANPIIERFATKKFQQYFLIVPLFLLKMDMQVYSAVIANLLAWIIFAGFSKRWYSLGYL